MSNVVDGSGVEHHDGVTTWYTELKYGDSDGQQERLLGLTGVDLLYRRKMLLLMMVMLRQNREENRDGR